MAGDKMKLDEEFGAKVIKADGETEQIKQGGLTMRQKRIIGYGFIVIVLSLGIYFLVGCTSSKIDSTGSQNDSVKFNEFVKSKKFVKTSLSDQLKKKTTDAVSFNEKASNRLVQGYLNYSVIRDGEVIAKFGPYKNTIVNAGENFMVDAFQNTVELETLKYHGIGTSSQAIAEADTGCVSELTTQYNPDSTRATGTTTEGASTNIYRTVATNTVDASVTIAEFCLMSQAATGGGTMWTRILISPTVGLNSGDSLQTTYDLTVE